MVTEVTPENIYYAKDLMEAIEIRHIPGIKGNFGVVDKSPYESLYCRTD